MVLVEKFFAIARPRQLQFVANDAAIASLFALRPFTSCMASRNTHDYTSACVCSSLCSKGMGGTLHQLYRYMNLDRLTYLASLRIDDTLCEWL